MQPIKRSTSYIHVMIHPVLVGIIEIVFQLKKTHVNPDGQLGFNAMVRNILYGHEPYSEEFNCRPFIVQFKILFYKQVGLKSNLWTKVSSFVVLGAWLALLGGPGLATM